MSNEINTQPGIYQIFNKVTGVSYIGQSVNPSKRCNTHRTNFKGRKVHNTYLQRSYDKHGPDAFEYRLVCNVPREFLTECEQYWIDYFTVNGGTYNYLNAQDSPVSDDKRKTRAPLSPESIAKMKATKAANPHVPTSEELERRRLAAPNLKYFTKEERMAANRAKAKAYGDRLRAKGLTSKNTVPKTPEEVSEINRRGKLGALNPMSLESRARRTQ